MNRTFSARIVCPRQLFVGFLFACLSNFCFAGWEEVTATTAQLKKQFSAVATKSLATDSPNQLKRKPTPRVSQFLSELGTAEARAMLGAFNASYSIIKKRKTALFLPKKAKTKVSLTAFRLLMWSSSFRSTSYEKISRIRALNRSLLRVVLTAS